PGKPLRPPVALRLRCGAERPRSLERDRRVRPGSAAGPDVPGARAGPDGGARTRALRSRAMPVVQGRVLARRSARHFLAHALRADRLARRAAREGCRLRLRVTYATDDGRAPPRDDEPHRRKDRVYVEPRARRPTVST